MKILKEIAIYFLIICGGIPIYLGIQNQDSYFLSHGVIILVMPLVILLIRKRRTNIYGEKQNAN